VPFERCATSRSWCTKKCDSQGLRPAPQREPTHPESMPSAKITSCKPLPSTDPLGAHLDYFRIVGNPYLIALRQSCASSAHDVYATCLAVHIRVGLLRRFCELTVFDARLYIRVRRVDQPA
jgi:hypothetical protein